MCFITLVSVCFTEKCKKSFGSWFSPFNQNFYLEVKPSVELGKNVSTNNGCRGNHAPEDVVMKPR